MELETSGIISTTRFRIESVLKERKAFDPNSAADLNQTTVNFQAMIDVMEQSGLIGKTTDGKIFMTQKGQEQQIRGFSINCINTSNRKFVRFSRNK
jgi:hypothetical protein